MVTKHEKTGAREEHVVLCVLGELGRRTLEELRRLGEEVVVIARAPAPEDADRAGALGATLIMGVPVLIGDTRLRETVEGLQLERARCAVVVTSADIANLETALGVHVLNPELRVVRLFDADLAARVERAFEIRSPAVPPRSPRRRSRPPPRTSGSSRRSPSACRR